MTTSVIVSLTIADNPVRQLEVQLPVFENKVVRYGQIGNVGGYPLNVAISCCESQAKAMSIIAEESRSVLDGHIGGLMASLMATISTEKQLSLARLDMYVDCFSYMLKADGFAHDEIVRMRPNIIRTIRELYPTVIKD